jgi:hypothetical protein
MLRLSTILVFNGILFLIYAAYKITEDSLIYLNLVMCPLLLHAVTVIFEKKKLSLREEDMLYWIDEFHVYEAEMKKVSNLQLTYRIHLIKFGGWTQS